MRRTIIALLLMVVLMVPFLSSCDSGDLQLLVDYAKLWAEVHNLTEPDGSVNLGAAGRFVGKNALTDLFGLSTTGDEVGDAVVDSARTMKDIRDAQKEANQGWQSLYDGKNVQDDVLPHYNQALSLRKEDWSYYNERGLAHLEDIFDPNAVKLAENDFNNAAQFSKLKQPPDVYIQMLKQRVEAMEKLNGHARDMHALLTKETLLEQSRTYGELASLTGDGRYTLLKQQVDSTVKEGMFVTANNRT
jgi:hypothetical protein